MINWSFYENFSEDEFRCHCGCGDAEMNSAFPHRLQDIRTKIGKPFVINSGFRCPVHNRSIGGGPAHPTGKAADIKASGELAHELICLAAPHFNGIGVSQRGPHDKRFIHLDRLETDEFSAAPRPWIWSY